MSEVASPEPDTLPSVSTSAPETSVEVFAVYGVEPEIQAYAMAKYSRSSLSMKDSLKEITLQKAEKFLNTFYFQYGHRSIADLAHIALAIERLSILAAIVVADEQRWDGQERSTRYQNFRKSGYYTPAFAEPSSQALYRETIESLFATYEKLSQSTFEYLASITPRPAEMKPDAYERTLRARAFDISRYLLPLATNTSLGEIVNARTLESQVAHLLSQPHKEVRDLGALLKKAALSPAYNANEESLRALVAEIRALSPELAERAERELLREVRVAPTLVKYADPSAYEIETRRELEQAAAELMRGAAIEPAPLVDLIDDDSTGDDPAGKDVLEKDGLEIELATTLLYGHCHYSYRQLRGVIAAAGKARRRELIDLGLRHRGRHDEMLRPFYAGQHFCFDILMDIGGFRDMHRHRRCTQIIQSFTTLHGFEIPTYGDLGPSDEEGYIDILIEAYCRGDFISAIKQAHAASAQIAASQAPEAAQSALYLLPLATRIRSLFKMDFAEAQYIAELRSAPAGHFSYRRVAWEMFLALQRQHPSLATHIRVTDFTKPIDLLQR